ncbi:MAG TPA: type II and III secretion system protein family protein [Pyrinomonadaceae bacterium]|nr:type II and III secretion system protein family protein [Pyrinomonadaceae bacterium]
MQPRPSARYFIVTLGTILLFALPLFAQDQATNASFSTGTKEAIPVNVLVGQSKVITFDRAIERFSVSNPEIAEAVLVSGNQVVVNGKAFGQVNFIAWEKGTGSFIVFDVYVRTNLSLIDSQIRALFPKDDIRLSQANGSVVISGTVSDPRIAAQADSVIQAAGFKTVNLLESPVKDLRQVQLLVRVAEVNRTRIRELGSSYQYQARPGVGGFASGGGPANAGDVTKGVLNSTFSSLNLLVLGGNMATMIRALQTQGALRALAEPNLIAMDGQQASFLAGGEYPVPIIQGGGDKSTVTIVFKEYGVRLNFKPTIIDEDHIRLELEPEVSTLDFANGVKFDGFVIPGLRTRRAHTGVELRDGQSFALGGLLDNSETRSLSKVPGLGDIPILGNLFKSTQFQKNESELMFIVTAQMVKPVNRDDLPAIPNVESLKKGSLLGIDRKDGQIDGPSGFILKSGSATTEQPAAPQSTEPSAPAKEVVPAVTPASSTKASLPSVSLAQPASGTAQAAKATPNP